MLAASGSFRIIIPHYYPSGRTDGRTIYGHSHDRNEANMVGRLNEWIDARTSGQTYGRPNGRTSNLTSGKMVGRSDRRTIGRTQGLTIRRIFGHVRTDGRSTAWTHG